MTVLLCWQSESFDEPQKTREAKPLPLLLPPVRQKLPKQSFLWVKRFCPEMIRNMWCLLLGNTHRISSRCTPCPRVQTNNKCSGSSGRRLSPIVLPFVVKCVVLKSSGVPKAPNKKCPVRGTKLITCMVPQPLSLQTVVGFSLNGRVCR